MEKYIFILRKPIYNMTLYRYREWSNTFIIVNDGLKRKYSDPYIYGDELKRILKETILDVLEVRKPSDNEILVIRILEGGRYYYVYEALSNILNERPLLGEIDIKSRIKYDPQDIVTKIIRDEGICEKAEDADEIYIGDTVASGKTMLTLLHHLKPCLRDHVEFRIMGFMTLYGLSRIKKWIDENGFKHIFIAYGALLGIAPNLTDMIMGGRLNYIPSEIKNYAVKKLGSEIANKLCVVGDFTYSTKYIDKYIAERIIQLWEIGVSSNSYDTKMKTISLIREGLSTLMKIGLNMNRIEETLAEEYIRRLFLMGEEAEVKRISIEKIISLKEIEVGKEVS